MPNPSRDKGSRFERSLVEALRAAGIDAYRIPLSGMQSGFKNDIQLRLPGATETIEAKSRRSGFKQLYQWITSAKYLCIKADRQEPLVAMKLGTFIELMADYQRTLVARENLRAAMSNNRESNTYKADLANQTKPIQMIRIGQPSVETTHALEGGGDSTQIHPC